MITDKQCIALAEWLGLRVVSCGSYWEIYVVPEVWYNIKIFSSWLLSPPGTVEILEKLRKDRVEFRSEYGKDDNGHTRVLIALYMSFGGTIWGQWKDNLPTAVLSAALAYIEKEEK